MCLPISQTMRMMRTAQKPKGTLSGPISLSRLRHHRTRVGRLSRQPWSKGHLNHVREVCRIQVANEDPEHLLYATLTTHFWGAVGPLRNDTGSRREGGATDGPTFMHRRTGRICTRYVRLRLASIDTIFSLCFLFSRFSHHDPCTQPQSLLTIRYVLVWKSCIRTGRTASRNDDRCDRANRRWRWPHRRAPPRVGRRLLRIVVDVPTQVVVNPGRARRARGRLCVDIRRRSRRGRFCCAGR